MTKRGAIVAAVFSVALLDAAGCVIVSKKYPEHYTHATKTQEQFKADRYDCEMAVKEQLERGMLNTGVFGDPRKAETDRCLREKFGWVPEKPAQPAP